MEKSWFG